MTLGNKAAHAFFQGYLLLTINAACFGGSSAHPMMMPRGLLNERHEMDRASSPATPFPQRSLDLTHAPWGQNQRRGWGSLSVNWLIGLQLSSLHIFVTYRVVRRMQHNRLLPGPNLLGASAAIVTISTVSRIPGIQRSHLPPFSSLLSLPRNTQCQQHSRHLRNLFFLSYDDRLGPFDPSSTCMHKTGLYATKRCDSPLRLSQCDAHSIPRCMSRVGGCLKKFVYSNLGRPPYHPPTTLRNRSIINHQPASSHRQCRLASSSNISNSSSCHVNNVDSTTSATHLHLVRLVHRFQGYSSRTPTCSVRQPPQHKELCTRRRLSQAARVHTWSIVAIFRMALHMDFHTQVKDHRRLKSLHLNMSLIISMR
jgi:hypothetical protein